MEFRRAIVREVPETYSSCRTSHPDRDSIDVKRAQEQHKVYIDVLSELGVEVIVLPKDNRYPDSCFVEDTAVIHGRKALISRLGAPSRQGEEDGVVNSLSDYFDVVRIEPPGTIEGGDVIHLPDHLISGLSQRTNQEGISQAEQLLGVPIKIIEDREIMHLKSYVTYLGRGFIVSTKRYIGHPVLRDFERIEVPPGEEYAANTLSLGDIVILPSGYPELSTAIKEVGFDTLEISMDQFMRCEGALTCLSLRF